MKSIQEYIKIYKESDRRKSRRRLPFRLVSEEDTRCRLEALYILEVERRGKHIILDDNTRDKIARVARWLCKSTKQGLILMGTPGNGKSTMLHCLFRLLAPYAVFGDTYEVVEWMKRQPQEFMKNLNEDVLLLDDLGEDAARVMNYGEETFPMTKLFSYRYHQMLTTIIATNLDANDIKDRYGDRVHDRLKETYEVIFYDAPSYRGK